MEEAYTLISTLSLIGLGLFGIGAMKRWRRRHC
jgi:hypothetical protein